MINNLNKENKEMLMTEARLKAPPSEKLVKYVHIPRLEREKSHFYEFRNYFDYFSTLSYDKQYKNTDKLDEETLILFGLFF